MILEVPSNPGHSVILCLHGDSDSENFGDRRLSRWWHCRRLSRCHPVALGGVVSVGLWMGI